MGYNREGGRIWKNEEWMDGQQERSDLVGRGGLGPSEGGHRQWSGDLIFCIGSQHFGYYRHKNKMSYSGQNPGPFCVSNLHISSHLWRIIPSRSRPITHRCPTSASTCHSPGAAWPAFAHGICIADNSPSECDALTRRRRRRDTTETDRSVCCLSPVKA